MKNTTVEILEFQIQEITIPIVGISPLIVNRFAEKAIKQLQDKHAGKAKNKKYAIREPEVDFEAAKHKSVDGWEGFPAAGFKAAMVRGCKSIGMVMKDTQTAFFIKSDCEITQLVQIFGEAKMRTDYVRVKMGGTDIRYRPEYVSWRADLKVEFNAGVLSLNQVYQMVKAAGYGCGLGEMRPEKGKFNYGRFKLAQEG